MHFKPQRLQNVEVFQLFSVVFFKAFSSVHACNLNWREILGNRVRPRPLQQTGYWIRAQSDSSPLVWLESGQRCITSRGGWNVRGVPDTVHSVPDPVSIRPCFPRLKCRHMCKRAGINLWGEGFLYIIFFLRRRENRASFSIDFPRLWVSSQVLELLYVLAPFKITRCSNALWCD